MTDDLFLVLQNGIVFKGKQFGHELKGNETIVGETVFATGMTGFVETLTDKSYFGQIIVQTFPLIGNYGVCSEDFESERVHARGYVVREFCETPSNFRCEMSIDSFLKSKRIVGICGIDTRKLTKIVRQEGVMNAVFTKRPHKVDFNELSSYRVKDAVRCVSTDKIVKRDLISYRFKVALLDFGFKEGIARELEKRGCQVTVFPHDTILCDALKHDFDGIMLSNGPGDPKENAGVIKMFKELLTIDIPIFGICLGHQLMALASGLEVCKLKYGHRGANQPVKDCKSGRIYITSQNHGYCVTGKIDPSVAKPTFVNMNDATNEGLEYSNNAFSVQFHPEGASGPMDTGFLFDKFVSMIEDRLC